MAEIVGIISGTITIVGIVKLIFDKGKEADMLYRKWEFAPEDIKTISSEAQMFGELMTQIIKDTKHHPDFKKNPRQGHDKIKRVRDGLWSQTERIYDKIGSFLEKVTALCEQSQKSGLRRNYRRLKAFWQWLQERALMTFTLDCLRLVKSSASLFQTTLIYRELLVYSKRSPEEARDRRKTLKYLRSQIRAKKKEHRELQTKIEETSVELPSLSSPLDILEFADGVVEVLEVDLERDRQERRERRSNGRSSASSSLGSPLTPRPLAPRDVPIYIPSSPVPPRRTSPSIIIEHSTGSTAPPSVRSVQSTGSGASSARHVSPPPTKQHSPEMDDRGMMLFADRTLAADDRELVDEDLAQSMSSSPPSVASMASYSSSTIDGGIMGVPTALFGQPIIRGRKRPESSRGTSVLEGFVRDTNGTVEDGYRRGRRRRSSNSSTST